MSRFGKHGWNNWTMKILRLLLCLTFTFGIFASRNVAADLNGRIVITKKITKKHVTLTAYQLRGVQSAPETDIPGDDNELRGVVVFLDGNLSRAATPIQKELPQHNRRFDPRLLVVPVESTVSFPNDDPIFHNVFSLSKAKRFDLGYYPAGQTRVVKFNEAGIVQVYCHLHANMYGAIVVVPNQWHARPADDGTFSFTGVPPGRYAMVAWHMSGGFFRKEVMIPETGDADVVIHIPVHDQDQ
jgi:plastocyanin